MTTGVFVSENWKLVLAPLGCPLTARSENVTMVMAFQGKPAWLLVTVPLRTRSQRQEQPCHRLCGRQGGAGGGRGVGCEQVIAGQ